MSNNSNNEPKVYYLEKRVIVVDGVEHDIICEFLVPQIGWELDYKAYIIEHGGERRLVYSDHGSLYLVGDHMIEVVTIDTEKQKLRKDHMWIKNQIRNHENFIEGFKEALSELEK